MTNRQVRAHAIANENIITGTRVLTLVDTMTASKEDSNADIAGAHRMCDKTSPSRRMNTNTQPDT
jgi:hypothetical protein